MASAGVMLLARAQLRRSWRAMIVLGLFAGLTGGVVLTSVQAARRTSTAYPRLERTTGVADAIVLATQGTEQAEQVAALPEVSTSWVTDTGIGQLAGDRVQFVGVIAGREAPPPGLVSPVVIEGRAADPDAPDEAVITEHIAEVSGFGVGDELDLTFLTPEEL